MPEKLRRSAQAYTGRLDIEEEVHYVAVPDDVVLPLYMQLACGPYRSFGLVRDEVFVTDDFGAL